MQFRQAYSTASQANVSNTFQLSPATSSIHLPQPRKIPNLSIDRKGLDLRNLADDFEVHQRFI
jgi:hypothetical protein